MPTIGLELCDAGFLTASCDKNQAQLVDVPDANGVPDWPGFAYAEGPKLSFGRAAEDNWFVHPRRVLHTFWARLAHEPSTLQVGAKPPSFSELSFFFLRDYANRLTATVRPLEKLTLAVPGAYLKDAATEEEKVGLLLGMFAELKLPLAGIVDMAAASLCDPRAPGFNPALPVVVIDLHLEGADVTLVTTDQRLQCRDFIHLPNSGYAHLLKQLNGTMGNRFLRHTTFDILADGRIEQTFFRQTKEFLLSDAPEWRYHINTATRAYEMIAKRDQLVHDAQTFASALANSVQSFIRNSPHATEPCTIALTDRTAHVPGLEARFRAAGFSRLLRLPRGAAACGAARLGESRLEVPADIADVAVERSVPLSEARRSTATQWEARLQKNRQPTARYTPTHAILDGVGHVIGMKPRFTIGLAELGADVALPDAFGAANECTVPLIQDQGRLWFVDAAPARGDAANASNTGAARTPIDAGDRLTVRCGNAAAEILFAHCPASNGLHPR